MLKRPEGNRLGRTGKMKWARTSRPRIPGSTSTTRYYDFLIEINSTKTGWWCPPAGVSQAAHYNFLNAVPRYRYIRPELQLRQPVKEYNDTEICAAQKYRMQNA